MCFANKFFHENYHKSRVCIDPIHAGLWVSALNVQLCEHIVQTAHAHRRWGYRMIHDVLRPQYPRINHKRLYRIYTAEALSIRKRKKTKRIGVRVPLVAALALNLTWSMDFVSDAIARPGAVSRRIKCLTVADDFSHECVDIGVDFGIGGLYVTWLLDRAATFRGYPKEVRTDNELNAIGVAQKQQAHPRLSKQPKKYSATSNPQSVVISTCYLGQRFTIMNTRSCSDGLRSSPNLKQSVAQWKVRTLSTGSYWPQRPYSEGSIHWAKLQSNSGKGLMI